MSDKTKATAEEEVLASPSKAVSARTWVILGLTLVLLATAVGVYATAFDNEFIWDDPIIFQRQLPYFDSFENVFFPPKKIPQFGFHYYRPLIVVSYQIDEWLAETLWEQGERVQARQVVYHSSVVVYHAVATFLVFLLGLRLAGLGRLAFPLDVAAAGGGALLFALHPIHVESVAWMAGRTDVICGIFVIGTLLTYLRYKDSGRWPDLLCAFGCGFAAMLSKETGVCILLIIPLVDLLVRRESAEAPARKSSGKKAKRLPARRKGARVKVQPASGKGFILPFWACWIGFAVTWACYAALREQAVNPNPLRSTGVDPVGFFASMGWYLGKTIWPGQQSAFVADIPGVGFALLGLLAAGGAAYLVYRAWWRSEAKGEALTAIIFFATLAPSLAIVLYRISETPLAERYLYLPSVGLCLLVGLALSRIAVRLPDGVASAARLAVVIVPILGIALPAAYATIARGEVWQDDMAFWSDTVKKADDQGLPHLHLGLTYNNLGDEEKALEQYREALEKYDDAEGRSKAYNNLGTLHLSRGELAQAAEALRGALKQVPRYPTANYNLALVEIRLSQNKSATTQVRNQHTQQAERYLARAIQLNPRYVKAHLQYGRLLLGSGRNEQGTSHLQTVVKLAPASREATAARKILSGQ